jgi:hypothetical protein
MESELGKQFYSQHRDTGNSAPLSCVACSRPWCLDHDGVWNDILLRSAYKLMLWFRPTIRCVEQNVNGDIRVIANQKEYRNNSLLWFRRLKGCCKLLVWTLWLSSISKCVETFALLLNRRRNATIDVARLHLIACHCTMVCCTWALTCT